jgi:uncharacterized cupredoxin-like copper-binding protein
MKRLGTFGVLATLVLVAGCGSSNDSKATTAPAAAKSTTTTTAAAKPAAATIAVVMKEFTVTPAPASVAAGKVTFKVSNKGKLKHEFVVVSTKKKADELMKGDEADETGNVSEIGNLPPGSTKKLSVMLKAGHYVLLCNLPGHYKAGQHHDFSVK